MTKRENVYNQYANCLAALSIPSSTAPASVFSSQASGLTVPHQPGDLLPGASPRKKPRKQQHVISNEEGEMMETNSTDEERANTRTPGSKAERPESPPREYVGELLPLDQRPQSTHKNYEFLSVT